MTYSSDIIFFCFFVTSIFAFWQVEKTGNADSCFCQLSGQVDDCCCTVHDVDQLNKFHIYPRLNNIVKRNYFRYIKLKLHRECPFWSDHYQCALKDCSVDICSEDELPLGLISSKCSVSDAEDQLGTVDTTISEDQKQSLEAWSDYDADKSYCVDLEEDAEDADWVDLLLNPEQYTGYRGESPHRIWSSIYDENCFLPEKKMKTHNDFHKLFLSKTCLEKRVFYRLISGLHASINIHLSYKYLLSDPRLPTKPYWGPKLNEFQTRFDAKTTNGKGPHWLKNLYFTYLLTLRAVTKAAPYWKEAVFFTGDKKEDSEVKQIILELIKSSKTCPSTFDEGLMFTRESETDLKEEFRLHYQNITRIMDCVGCEKCRLWGKLQTYGIGTALKILFSSDKWEEIPLVDGRKFFLSRTEIVALFNALNKLSSSIHMVNKFKILNEKRKEL